MTATPGTILRFTNGTMTCVAVLDSGRVVCLWRPDDGEQAAGAVSAEDWDGLAATAEQEVTP